MTALETITMIAAPNAIAAWKSEPPGDRLDLLCDVVIVGAPFPVAVELLPLGGAVGATPADAVQVFATAKQAPNRTPQALSGGHGQLVSAAVQVTEAVVRTLQSFVCHRISKGPTIAPGHTHKRR